MFFQLYWQYIATLLVAYLIARVVYTFHSLIKSRKGKNSDNVTVPHEFTENEDLVDDQDNEEFDPALPRNLKHVPLNFVRPSTHVMLKKSHEIYNVMNKRRSVRHFSSDPIPVEILHNIIRTAGTAPSGAHTEPWTFALVTSKQVKQDIKNIIELEEETNYKKRMGKVWTTDLQPLRTNWVKEYLTEAPAIIIVFKQMYSYKSNGRKKVHYYNEQSVSIATGLLLVAIHSSGLASLVTTPLNCGPQLRCLLKRPTTEKVMFLLPVGYPADACVVPDLNRKELGEILVEY